MVWGLRQCESASLRLPKQVAEMAKRAGKGLLASSPFSLLSCHRRHPHTDSVRLYWQGLHRGTYQSLRDCLEKEKQEEREAEKEKTQKEQEERCIEKIPATQIKSKKKKKKKKEEEKGGGEESEAWIEISGEGMRESVAAVWYSYDPCMDFRCSMQEMLTSLRLPKTSKRKKEEALHELLSVYLTVNPVENHGFIVAAFQELLMDLHLGLLSFSP